MYRERAQKAKVALAAIKEQKTINELTTEFGIHSTQINNWKKQGIEGLNNAFSSKVNNKKDEDKACVKTYINILVN